VNHPVGARVGGSDPQERRLLAGLLSASPPIAPCNPVEEEEEEQGEEEEEGPPLLTCQLQRAEPLAVSPALIPK